MAASVGGWSLTAIAERPARLIEQRQLKAGCMALDAALSPNDILFLIAFFSFVAIVAVVVLMRVLSPATRNPDPPDDLYWLTLPGLRARYRARSKEEKATYLSRFNNTARLVFLLFLAAIAADTIFDQPVVAIGLIATAMVLHMRAYLS
jgi:hypothetical protein